MSLDPKNVKLSLKSFVAASLFVFFLFFQGYMMYLLLTGQLPAIDAEKPSVYDNLIATLFQSWLTLFNVTFGIALHRWLFKDTANSGSP